MSALWQARKQELQVVHQFFRGVSPVGPHTGVQGGLPFPVTESPAYEAVALSSCAPRTP